MAQLTNRLNSERQTIIVISIKTLWSTINKIFKKIVFSDNLEAYKKTLKCDCTYTNESINFHINLYFYAYLHKNQWLLFEPDEFNFYYHYEH